MADCPIKILGERSTGTNLLSKILHENFEIIEFSNSSGIKDAQKAAIPSAFAGGWSSRRAAKEAILDHNHWVDIPENGGWKHAAVTQRFLTEFARVRGCKILCLVRHPAEWAVSMHRNPFHGIAGTPKEFSTFLRSPWLAAARDELGQRLLSDPLTLYLKKVESYQWLAGEYDDVHVLRYEDVLLATETTMHTSGLTEWRKPGRLHVPEKSARHFGKGQMDRSGYQEKARNSSYGNLSKPNQALFQSRLENTILGTLYPFD